MVVGARACRRVHRGGAGAGSIRACCASDGRPGPMVMVAGDGSSRRPCQPGLRCFRKPRGGRSGVGRVRRRCVAWRQGRQALVTGVAPDVTQTPGRARRAQSKRIRIASDLHLEEPHPEARVSRRGLPGGRPVRQPPDALVLAGELLPDSVVLATSETCPTCEQPIRLEATEHPGRYHGTVSVLAREDRD